MLSLLFSLPEIYFFVYSVYEVKQDHNFLFPKANKFSQYLVYLSLVFNAIIFYLKGYLLRSMDLFFLVPLVFALRTIRF